MKTFGLEKTGPTIGDRKILITRLSGNMENRGVVPEIAIKAPTLAGAESVLAKAAAFLREKMEGRRLRGRVSRPGSAEV